jgi:hypothetical protein
MTCHKVGEAVQEDSTDHTIGHALDESIANLGKCPGQFREDISSRTQRTDDVILMETGSQFRQSRVEIVRVLLTVDI